MRIRYLAALAAISLLPSSLQAQCVSWDASGKFEVTQSNRTIVTFNLEQKGELLKGHAVYNFDPAQHFGTGNTGTVEGTIKGNSIQLNAYWSGERTVGVYTGTINQHGRAEGETFSRLDPSTRAIWYSSPMNCLAQSAPVAPPVASPPAEPAIPLGRVVKVDPASPGTEMSLCDRALSARERNSPAAPALERNCLAFETNTFAARGVEIAAGDPVVARLRDAQVDASARRGFEVGLGAAEMDWELGRQRIRNGLDPMGQQAFATAVAFSLSRQPTRKPGADAADAADKGDVVQMAGTNRADALIAAIRISELRQQNDLNDVTEDAALTEVAMAHSRKMVAASQLTHTAPGESPLEERSAEGNYTSQLIYASDQGLDFVLKAWDGMPVQRTKLLSPKSTRFGIAAINSRTGNTNRLYWTLVIGE